MQLDYIWILILYGNLHSADHSTIRLFLYAYISYTNEEPDTLFWFITQMRFCNGINIRLLIQR